MNAYNIRSATGRDLSFIYDTWLNVFRYDSPLGKSCRNSVFFAEYKLVIDRILSESETLIAHAPEDENLIFAYLTHNKNILHFAFCKEAFRRLGITKALFVKAFGDELAKIDYSHRTGFVAEFLREKEHLTHNPFHLFIKGAV